MRDTTVLYRVLTRLRLLPSMEKNRSLSGDAATTFLPLSYILMMKDTLDMMLAIRASLKMSFQRQSHSR